MKEIFFGYLSIEIASVYFSSNSNDTFLVFEFRFVSLTYVNLDFNNMIFQKFWFKISVSIMLLKFVILKLWVFVNSGF